MTPWRAAPDTRNSAPSGPVQPSAGPRLKMIQNMNSRIRIVLAGLACAVACAVAVADMPPPAADVQISGPAPSQAHVWMSGHWNSEGGQWKWAAAHWELPPSRSAIWVVGHWAPSGGNWVWVNGAWSIAEEPQAQAGPPQPPGTLAEAPQAGAMPGTPAPYVDGQLQAQYGPGGVVRQAYPVAGTTDYGPEDAYPAYYPAYDYSSYGYPAYGYPAYGWAGYPVYWGLPGVSFGFGWGPGFRGWGRGGYGYGHGGGRGFGGHGSGGQTHFSHGGSGHFGH